MQDFDKLFNQSFPKALCAGVDMDPETWFSDDLNLQDAAITICSMCTYGPEGDDSCYELALELDSKLGHAWGVWGGRTGRERQLILDAEDGDSGA